MLQCVSVSVRSTSGMGTGLISRRQSVRVRPHAPNNFGVNVMKQKTFENIVTKEQFVCPNAKDIRVIDNVEYLPVQKTNSPRVVLMRRDALRPVVLPKVVKNA